VFSPSPAKVFLVFPIQSRALTIGSPNEIGAVSLQHPDGKRHAQTAAVSRSFVLAPIFYNVGTVSAIGWRRNTAVVRAEATCGVFHASG
jgi:hypothetical protein